MIEIYTMEKGKEKTEGYVDGKTYLDDRKKKWGYLDGNIAKSDDGYPLLILNENGKITLNEDWDYEQVGLLKDGKILVHHDNKMYYSFHKDRKQIFNHQNGAVSYLRGDGIERLDDTDFFGILAIIFELFSGGGAPEPEEFELFDDDFFEDFFED